MFSRRLLHAPLLSATETELIRLIRIKLRARRQTPKPDRTDTLKSRVTVFGDSMQKILLLLSLLPVISAAGATDYKEHNIRPGLWEVTTTSMLLALVPQIPPDQMQKLTSLAKQYGLDMPQIQNGAATSRVCITQQMADQKIPSYFHAQQSGCSIKNAVRTENSYKMDLVCTNSQLKGNGRAEGTFMTPESFSGWTIFNGSVQDRPVNEHADTTGRWISASCETAKTP